MTEKKYKVESHIPIPGRGGPREGTSEIVETILKLNVGDSFVYMRSKDKKRLGRCASNAHNQNRQAMLYRGLNRKIATRILMDGDEWVVRIWRIL